jgi:MscS family membrane protein
VASAALAGAACTVSALRGSVAPHLSAALLKSWQLVALSCGLWSAVYWQQVAFSRAARASPADAGTLGVLSTLTQRGTAAAAALLALHLLGVPLAALVTFGGVGGLALGLASQVAASNLVAGASLLLAQPFRVGDKIDLPGRGLTGFVTRFALDNTQVTLEDTSVVTLPNAELAKSAVRNLSRLSHWRVAATFRVPYGALGDVRALTARLEAYCRGREDFHEAPPRIVARVVLADVAEYALAINVTTFLKAPGVTLPEFERRRHEILIALGEMIAAAGVQLAVPTSSVALLRGPGGAEAGGDAGGAAVPLRASGFSG